MRLYNAYINIKAAEGVNSGFVTKKIASQIEEEKNALWTLAQDEEEAEEELDRAERDSDIDAIEKAEKREIKDIEDAVNYAFNVVREGVLLLHTQLDELNELIAQDEILKRSGFPEEMADELEKMLEAEVEKIITHLRKIDRSVN
jgi:hypothetical protein